MAFVRHSQRKDGALQVTGILILLAVIAYATGGAESERHDIDRVGNCILPPTYRRASPNVLIKPHTCRTRYAPCLSPCPLESVSKSPKIS
ncbi:hypothetical protein C8J57DRAFT_1323174 [Mycena rebaudengoi]|nr:hypothetical protein C8J57DRAFT_1323174 [Mycena rebaudengoi]